MPLAQSIVHMDRDSLPDLSDPTLNTLTRLDERNRIAQDFIESYAQKHAKIDVAVGAVGLIPGFAIPALVVAIVAQSPLIYQPLAKDLQRIYMAAPETLEEAKQGIVREITVQTGALDVSADFGVQFIEQIAGELLMEAGWGVGLATLIPVVGALVGAALDYLIATQMTWRVGTMVSIYFQNGGSWVGDQKHTLELARQMTGPIHVGVGDLLDGRFKNQTARTDLNEIRQTVPVVRENLLNNVRRFVSVLRAATGDDRIRDILRAQGIPIDLIDVALEHLS